MMALHAVKHYSGYITLAREAEAEQDLDQAVEYYELAIRQKPLDEEPYERLMVIYRKGKKYKEELRVINKALDIYKTHFKRKSEKLYGGNQKLERAGRALLKSLMPGGSSEELFPEPVPKWQKRKHVVEKKMQASKRK